MSQDPAYYAARATEERRLATAATDPRVRRVHLEMAAEYAVLAGVDVTPSHGDKTETELRRTA